MRDPLEQQEKFYLLYLFIYLTLGAFFFHCFGVRSWRTGLAQGVSRRVLDKWLFGKRRFLGVHQMGNCLQVSTFPLQPLNKLAEFSAFPHGIPLKHPWIPRAGG